MGIDYSSSMGYGYAVPSKQFNSVCEIAGIEDPGDTLDWRKWLDEHGFNFIAVAHCGSMMDDENYLLFHINGTYIENVLYDNKILTEVDALPVPETDAMVQLSNAMTALSVEGPLSPGWKLFLNIF